MRIAPLGKGAAAQAPCANVTSSKFSRNATHSNFCTKSLEFPYTGNKAQVS